MLDPFPDTDNTIWEAYFVAADVHITWPNGNEESLLGLVANRAYAVTQGSRPRGWVSRGQGPNPTELAVDPRSD